MEYLLAQLFVLIHFTVALVGDGGVGKTAWVKSVQAKGDIESPAVKLALTKYIRTP
jgi:ABC-type phosphate/phosphonate transport system ATPase subunit